MASGCGDVDRIEARSTKARNGSQNVGITKVSLGMFREVPAQGLDAFSFHASNQDAGVDQAMCDREPAHAGRLHHRLDAVAILETIAKASNKTVERGRVVPEPDRPPGRAPLSKIWAT